MQKYDTKHKLIFETFFNSNFLNCLKTSVNKTKIIKLLNNDCRKFNIFNSIKYSYAITEAFLHIVS